MDFAGFVQKKTGKIIIMQKQTLIIVGAGITGLVAAYELAGHFDIIILEAQDRSGGRIHTIVQQGTVVEAGAEFIHGHLPLTFNLLKKAGIGTQKIEGKMYRYKNGKLVEQQEMVEGWDQLLKEMKNAGTDTTLSDFLNHHYPGDNSFKKEVESYAEGFDLADPSLVSVKSLYKEWSKEEGDNYRVSGGYSVLVDWLEAELVKKGVKLYTGKCVKQVDWQENDITITTATEEKLYSNKLLVTIPVSMLGKVAAAGSINFTPEIDGYQKAAAGIGFGGVVKVVLLFEKPCWPPNAGFIISDQPFRTWWSRLPGEPLILTGWAGGAAATAMKDKTDDEILAVAFASLSTILDIPTNELEALTTATYVFNWPAGLFIGGGYSYETLDSASAKEILNTPVLDTIFFAGEGLYSGDHPGTVEAAIDSALHVVKLLQ